MSPKPEKGRIFSPKIRPKCGEGSLLRIKRFVSATIEGGAQCLHPEAFFKRAIAAQRILQTAVDRGYAVVGMLGAYRDASAEVAALRRALRSAR